MAKLDKLGKLALAALQADIELKEAEKIAKERKDALIKALQAEDKWNTDTKAAGPVRLKIQNNRFFDVDTAVRFVDEDTVKKATVEKVDAKILKAFMTPNDVEASMKSYPQPYKLSLEPLRD